MCKTVVRREMLGSREQGYSLWNGKEVVEMTSKQIASALQRGEEIHGLALSDSGELVLDQKFFTRNIMQHRLVNGFEPMIGDNQGVVNVFYIILGRNKTGCYEMISTKFERGVLTEDKLKALYDVGVVSAGAKIEAGKIVLPGEDKLEKDKGDTDAKKEPQKK